MKNQVYLNKKAEVGLFGIAMVFILLVVYVALLPTLDAWISRALPYVQNSVLAVWGLKLLPLALLIKIALVVFIPKNQGVTK
jgi:hypothetical protein